ncbi:hypothetical protein [Tyzzerella sp. An114]|uniref:hypothetical protein n=1 Tax=Tyzzerella sp. An114 TaxID=1965545 RepID=UPI0013022922|nr:hypothetical protein [Tyzzerella sp. An114]
MYENTRKHYRVAQKEISANPQRGIYITKQQQEKLLLIGIIITMASFLTSIITALKLSK